MGSYHLHLLLEGNVYCRRGTDLTAAFLHSLDLRNRGSPAATPAFIEGVQRDCLERLDAT